MTPDEVAFALRAINDLPVEYRPGMRHVLKVMENVQNDAVSIAVTQLETHLCDIAQSLRVIVDEVIQAGLVTLPRSSEPYGPVHEPTPEQVNAAAQANANKPIPARMHTYTDDFMGRPYDPDNRFRDPQSVAEDAMRHKGPK